MLHSVIGHLNELHMALAMFPISRNSVWNHFFGIPFERALRYHRWLGRIAWLVRVRSLFGS